MPKKLTKRQQNALRKKALQSEYNQFANAIGAVPLDTININPGDEDETKAGDQWIELVELCENFVNEAREKLLEIARVDKLKTQGWE